MSPHLIQSAAKAQMDDRLRSAERRRLAAHARARRSASVAPSSARRLPLRSLRAVFG
jgi:hypothetical protein